jgi:hypothetical protein
VIDAQPLPTTKDQCKNGGWKQFGFKNQVYERPYDTNNECEVCSLSDGRAVKKPHSAVTPVSLDLRACLTRPHFGVPCGQK